MKKKVLLLILVSPIVAELISGSTPFFTFFRPSIFLVYTGFYGIGCLLIREITSHRKLGYASVLLLGAAFGVLEEGIILRSWFDPSWMGAQITSQALRVYGISVLQPFANVVYHAVISIATPILLIESLTSREPWLTNKELIFGAVLFVISAVLLSAFNDYRIEGSLYLLGMFLFLLFAGLGLRGIVLPQGVKVFSPEKIWLLGALFVFLLFAIFYSLSSAGVSWIIILGLVFLLYGSYTWVGSRLIWKKQHCFAGGGGIVTGLLIVVAMMARLDPAKMGNLFCAVFGVIILVLLYRRVI
ncbi:MAG: hypothetical protein HXS44_00845 [Theionarchaea archaeon]|nr:hypothetical protein [Theionarchaea archaeon]